LYPQEIYSEDGLNVWHYIDKDFVTPKVNIWLRFVSNQTIDSPESAVLLTLMGMLFKEALNETIYMASMAELEAEISTQDIELEILVSGFSDKAILLLETLVQSFFSPDQYILENNLNRLKEQLQRRYTNATMKASKAADACRLNALKPSRYPYEILQNVLSNNTLNTERMLQYVSSFFSTCCLYIYAHGNVENSKVLSFVDSFKRMSRSVDFKLSQSHFPDQIITKIPQANAIIMPVTPSNLKETNNCVQAYYQHKEFDIVSSTYLDLIEQIISEPFFNDLRTKQQLGYDVSCTSKDTYGVLGYCFEVVSSSHTVAQVQAAMLSFADKIPKMILNLSDSNYNDHINALINIKITPRNSLNENAHYYYNQIKERRYQFNINEEEIKILRNGISKKELSDFSTSLFSSSSRHLLLIQSSAVSTLVPLKDKKSKWVGTAPIDLHKKSTTQYFPNLV
jgi:nardilysin